MPNRILKESITTSATVDALTSEEECFFYRLLVVADDFGRMDGRPAILRARCFPLRVDHIKDEDITAWLDALVAVELIRIEGDRLRIVDWTHHGIHRPRDPRRPILTEWLELRRQIFERDNFTCRYCGKRGGRLHCDHIIPLSRGGSSDVENLATACQSCNCRKHDRTPAEWLGSR